MVIIVKGIILKGIIIIVQSTISLVYPIYSLYCTSIQSPTQSILFLT
jgi:hypothetical protein